MLQSINPYTQEVIETFEEMSDAGIEQKLQRADRAFVSWRNTMFAQRSDWMINVSKLLRSHPEGYATSITREMGKILNEAKAEVEKCATACDYYAEHAERFLRDTPIETEAQKSMVVQQPLGVVLAVMPWNFPFWQVFRFAVPTLMAGNTIVLKHAANVSGSALLIEKIFREAGLPDDVFQTLLVESKHVEKIIAHDVIKAVTLTGSEYAGTKVAAAAGSNLKKTVLELGGSDPFLVLRDADVEAAAKTAVQSRMQNAGQSCIAAKRFFVDQSIYESFVASFLDNVKAIRQGDPFDGKTTMGPVARMDIAESVEKQMNESLKAGAALAWGGGRLDCNMEPTVLLDAKPGMAVVDEEVFGPVAPIIRIRDEREGIELANSHRYGLGATIFSSDVERAEYLARQIETGAVFINAMMRADSRLPFGGIKKSGYGRELSQAGILEFVNSKTIYIK